MVMLHIKLKGNDACSNMVTNSLFVPRVGSQDQKIFFLKIVMLHIKMSKLFSECGHVINQIKGHYNCQRI